MSATLVNELSHQELDRLLVPILRLEPEESILAGWTQILRVDVSKTSDLACQTQVLVRYAQYQIDVLDIRWIEDKGMSVHLQFAAKEKWWHNFFKDQNAELVSRLKNICAREIVDVRFAEYAYGFSSEGISQKLNYLYDDRAFNANWRRAFDISPMLIAPDAHHGRCFVEFYFNPGGYVRTAENTRLRENWLDNAFDVTDEIERGANRLLGLSGLQRESPTTRPAG